VGDLTTRRDFCDVRDVVRAYRLLVERGVSGEVYNIASGRDVSLQDIADQLVADIAPHVRLVRDRELLRPAEIQVLRGSYEKLRAQTGWEPTIPLSQSLRDVVADMRLRRSVR
jgi:GDP-4-dehydro-6-deoxy-D-mannose reductase